MADGIGAANTPSASANFPDQNANDPMMDYLVASRFGLPQAPAGSQGPDMAQQFQQQMQAPNAMLAALTGHAMSAPEELQRLIPGRAGNALSNAGLAMSMIPTGRTIGENIQGVSNAMTELPYARLMHAYQMLQPQLGGMQAQAGIQELLGRGQYYSGRNMSDIYAQQQRGEAAAQDRAHQQEIMAGVGKQPYTMFKTAEKDDPNGRWKKGESVAYYHQQVGGGVDPESGQFIPKYQDSEPYASMRDLQAQGSVDPQGRMTGRPTGAASSLGPLMQMYKDTHSGSSDWEAASAVEKLLHANPALANFFGEQPTKDARATYASQKTAATDMYNKALESMPKPDSEAYQVARDNAYDAYARPFIAKKQKPPLSESAFGDQYDTAQKGRRDALDTAYSKYNSLPPSKERDDFDTFLQQQMSAQGGQPTGAQPQVRDYTNLK